MTALRGYVRWALVPVAAVAAFIVATAVVSLLAFFVWSWRVDPHAIGNGSFLALFFIRFSAAYSAVLAAVEVAPSAKNVVAIAAPTVILTIEVVFVGFLIAIQQRPDSWVLLTAELLGLSVGSILAAVERYQRQAQSERI